MDIYTTLMKMLLEKTKKDGVRTGLKMAMELYEQSGHLSYNDLYDKELLEEAIDGCLVMDESDSKMIKRYRLKISYSWGDEEETEKSFDDFEDAWTIAQKMALKEMETASSEYGDDNGNCEIGLTFDKTRRRIDLHYTHDDSHCYYDIVESLVDAPDSMNIPLEGGTLIAERSLDPDYPGIDIEFIPDGNAETAYTYPRVVVEKPKGKKLRCLVWGNKDSEDYTDKIEFDSI